MSERFYLIPIEKFAGLEKHLLNFNQETVNQTGGIVVEEERKRGEGSKSAALPSSPSIPSGKSPSNSLPPPGIPRAKNKVRIIKVTPKNIDNSDWKKLWKSQ